MADVEGLRDPLRPVMTLQVADHWIAVRIDQMESVALAAHLWPVPLAQPGYVGLHDNGEQIVPVLALDEHTPASTLEQLVAILEVRGRTVGLAIQRAGRVHEHYWVDDAAAEIPPSLERLGAQLAHASEQSFWLIDTDNLWQPHPLS